MSKPKKPKKQPTGDYPVGYCRPPARTQIQKDQVLNPFGAKGKPKTDLDAFEKAAARPSRMTVDGQISVVPSDEAFWLSQMARALAGDKSAARNVAAELGARRRLAPGGPPPPTAEELAQAEAEQAQREELSARLVGLLEEKVAEKRNSGPDFRYGPDGRPIEMWSRR